jgi:glycosyltransferase involved in cell wall biosynthesis
MVASWQSIKRPLIVLEACRLVIDSGVKLELHIVGDGPQRNEMELLASTGALAGQVSFLGPLVKSRIAEEMRNADALLHASAYETFSVVCAEAISCGTPVLASRLDAIGDFVNSSNGVLVDNTVDAWRQEILRFCREPHQWDRPEIAARAHARFSPAVVGRQFRDLYRKLWTRSS